MGQIPPGTGKSANEKIRPGVAQGALGQTYHETVQAAVEQICPSISYLIT